HCKRAERLSNLRAPRPARLPKPKPMIIKIKPADSRYERGTEGGQVSVHILAPTFRSDDPRRYRFIIRRGFPQHVDDRQLQLIPPEKLLVLPARRYASGIVLIAAQHQRTVYGVQIGLDRVSGLHSGLVLACQFRAFLNQAMNYD
ncbi:hypothetical protein AB9K34_03830, partial [Sedimentitalea sp. XS_ASV28]|uniref:hypothetical protein n=1 Tax=Sedimentitalea sp. XS_ASV28 TaxID=3241296 RepID=UPI0035132756